MEFVEHCWELMNVCLCELRDRTMAKQYRNSLWGLLGQDIRRKYKYLGKESLQQRSTEENSHVVSEINIYGKT